MKEIFPDYYKKFKCIADKCQHSCCVGWEIDIDQSTMDLYNSLEGEFADKIRENIEGEVPHFVLKEGERCPFLNDSGLCDIICELGENALCDICHLHPRFRNFYPNLIETGLGLCCEEAARIILTDNEKFSVSLPLSARMKKFFKERKNVFDILQNREVSILTRFHNLAEKYDLKFEFSNDKLYELYKSLERLDLNWEKELEKLKTVNNNDIFTRDDLQIFFEQLACYFVFRHFQKGVGLALLSCWVIGVMCSLAENSEQMIDIARMYSSEIEYCEENTGKIIEFLGEKQ